MSCIRVIGVGDDGWGSLPAGLQAEILAADLLLGGERHLAMVPAVDHQRRTVWPTPLRAELLTLLESATGTVVALASGDPLVAGIGATLIDLLGAASVSIEPNVSSVSLASARLGWAADSVDVIRDPRTLPRFVGPRRRLLVLSSDETTPAAVAATLTALGHGASTLTVLAHLGSTQESSMRGTAHDWSFTVPRLHVLAVECEGPALPTAPGLPDESFDHDGQLTKRDVRASALSRLSPFPGAVLWDVGAGAGSVGIEWMLASGTGVTWAIERDPARADRIEANARRLGVPAIRVVRGSAPQALESPELPTPDAVFLGGGVTASAAKIAWAALRPGGTLVAHAVARETVREIEDLHAELGGELTRIQVEHVDRLGSFTGWRPARTITQWAVRKESR